MARHNRDAEWLEKLQHWKASGKSGGSWAKEQNIPDYIFWYWRRKLLGQAQAPSKKFVELTDSPKSCEGIVLESKGIVIHLSKHFETTTLKRFLEVLRAL